MLAPLKSGLFLSDDQFDLVYAPAVRRLSTRHWTPIRVAYRAAKLLTTGRDGARILDVGSGAGKFCIVGSLTSSGTFVGVEQRLHLVQEARRVCGAHGIHRVEFLHGNMVDLDWTKFDAIYLFNPFFENVLSLASIDDTVPLGFERYKTYVNVVRRKLRDLPVGVRVATYHGFGGTFPDCYELKLRERIGSDCLKVWVKVRDAEPLCEAELAAADLAAWELARQAFV